MNVSTIVLVIIRLFSIQWLIHGLVLLAYTRKALSYVPENSLVGTALGLSLPPFLQILLAVWAWKLGPWLARRVVDSQDAPVKISGLTLEDLYSFAFVFLGLYYVLDSVGGIVNWIYYGLSAESIRANRDFEIKSALYQLSNYMVPFCAGFACLVLNKKFAKKLANNCATAVGPPTDAAQS